MSKSYKKTPIVKDKNKGMKNLANRKVRRSADYISNGKYYRKMFQSYDISDYLFREDFCDFKNRYERDCKHYLNGVTKEFKEITEKELYLEWYKIYKMK